MTRTIAAVLTIALTASACAGRAPAPVPVVQAMDSSLNCTAIVAEVNANDGKIRELGREEGNKVAQNVVAGVAGLLIWPLWFAMDFQGAASKEVTALQQRQSYLAKLSEQKNCATAPMPAAMLTTAG